MNVFSTTTDNKLTDGMLVLVENMEQLQEYQRTNLDNRFSDAFQVGMIMNTNGTYPFAIEDMNIEGTFAAAKTLSNSSFTVYTGDDNSFNGAVINYLACGY